jgi:hypothetical protein
MKKCKNVSAWTDYPFVELGDIPFKPAPIRHALVLSYDQDKYAKIYVQGHDLVTEVKWGYLYRKPGRLGQVKNISRRKFERMIERTV